MKSQPNKFVKTPDGLTIKQPTAPTYNRQRFARKLPRMLKKTLFVAIIAILPALDISAWSQAAADFSVERNVAMKTRDGVTLCADIYRPAGMASSRFCWSALLTTSAVRRSGRAALRGYMVVVQDVRGRYTSEGEWYPFKYEMKMATTRWSGRPRCRTRTGK